MTLFYNNRTNLLHKILVKNAMRKKNEPNSRSRLKGNGRVTKILSSKTYFQLNWNLY